MTDLPDHVREAMYRAMCDASLISGGDKAAMRAAALSALSAAGYAVVPQAEIDRLREIAAEDVGNDGLTDTERALDAARYEWQCQEGMRRGLERRLAEVKAERDEARDEVARLTEQRDAVLAACEEMKSWGDAGRYAARFVENRMDPSDTLDRLRRALSGGEPA